MKYFRIVITGVFALTCLKVEVASSNNMLSPSTFHNCPLIDDISKLDFKYHDFETKLMQILTKKDPAGNYYISNPGCKDEIMYFLNETCDRDDYKAQIICEMSYLLTKEDTILEKYKSLPLNKQITVQNYVNQQRITIAPYSDENTKNMLAYALYDFKYLRNEGIIYLLLGLSAGIALMRLDPRQLLDNDLLYYISLFWSGVFFIKGSLNVLYATKMPKDARLRLEKIDTNTGLKAFETEILIKSFVKYVKLAYDQENAGAECIRALE